MKKNIILQLIFILLTANNLMSQTTTSYFLVPYEESDLEPISKIRMGDYWELEFSDNSFTELFEDKKILEYKKSFLETTHSYLSKVYEIKLEESDMLKKILRNNLIEHAELIQEPKSAFNFPNDYNLPNGKPNDYLELIRAPLAWTLTTGNPNVLVGVSDTYFTLSHEELANKIVQIIGTTSTNNSGHQTHGTEVASLIAANTNNDLGISSIGYNTKLVGHNGMGYSGVWTLSQIPNIKVINMSWITSYSAVQDTLYRHIRDDLNIVLVAAAGNGYYGANCGGEDGNNYCYPASYESVISVTGVGSRFPVGTNDEVEGMKYWKDVAEVTIGNSHSTMTINDKVNISAPAYRLYRASNTGGLEGSIDTYTDAGVGTSIAAPLVSGTTALIFAVNPDLTALQVKEILEATADSSIYGIPENHPYIGKLGSGRLNAYKAVLMAKCMAEPTGIDLYIKDSPEDFGEEPNTASPYTWSSTDIWVRNINDGEEENQNPEYHPTNPNYVYVKIRNRGCSTSTGNDMLKLYWSKAATSLSWDYHWNENNTFDNGAKVGSEIGTIVIPPVESGDEVIIAIPWINMPNPNDYTDINPEPWHFCLLARIISEDDPITFPETEWLAINVANNNNIAQKNVTIVDLEPNTVGKPIGGVIAVGNIFDEPRKYSLELVADNRETGKKIFEEAEVSVNLDPVLLEAWVRGGKQGTNVRLRGGNKLIITGDNAKLENIDFDSRKTGTLNLTFNFLTKEITDKEEYNYHVIQKDDLTGVTIGGETYEIRKYPRGLFYANAENKLADKNTPITLNAQTINESAVYNWYDNEGNLIYEGADFTVSVEVGKKYKLEVIALSDGYKDYTEVEVKLKPNSITTLYPNPTSNQVTVAYKINQGDSAYLSVNTLYGSNNISHNYVLNIEENEITLDVSSYPQGLYIISLITNGQVSDTTTLIKQ